MPNDADLESRISGLVSIRQAAEDAADACETDYPTVVDPLNQLTTTAYTINEELHRYYTSVTCSQLTQWGQQLDNAFSRVRSAARAANMTVPDRQDIIDPVSQAIEQYHGGRQ